MKLTTHLNLVLRLRTNGAIPPLLQYVFMAWCLIKGYMFMVWDVVKRRGKFTFITVEWGDSNSNTK